MQKERPGLTRAAAAVAIVVMAGSGVTVAVAPTATADVCDPLVHLVCGGAKNRTGKIMNITFDLDDSDGKDQCYVWNYDGPHNNPVQCTQEVLSDGAVGGNGTFFDVDAFTFNNEGYHQRVGYLGKWHWRQKGVWTKFSSYEFVDCGIGDGSEIWCTVLRQVNIPPPPPPIAPPPVGRSLVPAAPEASRVPGAIPSTSNPQSSSVAPSVQFAPQPTPPTSRVQAAPPPTLDTFGVQNWILSNIVPLLLLLVALLLLWLGGGKGDNAGVMRRLSGLIVALAVVGIAVSGAGVDIGSWLAKLFGG